MEKNKQINTMRIALFSLVLIVYNIQAANVDEQELADKSPSQASWTKIHGELIRPDKLKEDLDFLFKSIEEVHPNMYAYTSKEEFSKHRELLYEKINQPMNHIEFYKLVAPTVASLKNGHTFLFPLVEDFAKYAKEGRKVLPISLDWDGEKAILARNYSSQALPLGGEILTINDQNAGQVIRKLARYFPADGKDSFPWQLERDELLRPCFWLEYETADSVDINIKAIDGTVTKHTIWLMALDKIRAKEPANKGKNSCRYLPESDTCLIELNDWSTPDGIGKFCQVAFKEIRDRKASNLIVDIRNNPGGDSKCAEVVIEYLTERPYQLFEESEVKLSRQFCKKYWAQAPEQLIGTIYTQKIPLTHPKPNPLLFKGQIFILIGVRSTSTSLAFAAAAKHFTIGMLVGEEPAEDMTSYGHAFEFKLPNSGLRCMSACQVYVYPDSKNDKRGLIPDYKIRQRPEDTAKGIDTALEFTLNLIKQSDGNNKNP